MNFEEYNVLGNIINTTWGHGSTNNSSGATMSIKAQLLGEDRMILSYNCIINFGAPQERTRELNKISTDAGSILNAAINKIKKEFKEETGRTLKVENISDDDDYSLLTLGQNSGRRDALYHRKIVLQLG